MLPDVTTDGTAVSRTDSAQNQIETLGARPFNYDADGNLLGNGRGRAMIYDAWKRLVDVYGPSAGQTSYPYDAWRPGHGRLRRLR